MKSCRKVLGHSLLQNAFSLASGGSVFGASGCHVGGCEFDSSWTNTHGLKITEEKVLPL